jgi:hypothetical protein
MVDIEGLLRVPWNIEVKISAPSGVTSMGDPEYLKIDAYLDSSDLACPSSGDMTSDNLRIIKVRGIVLDSKGNPFFQPILNDRTIMTSLLWCMSHHEGRHRGSLFRVAFSPSFKSFLQQSRLPLPRANPATATSHTTRFTEEGSLC